MAPKMVLTDINDTMAGLHADDVTSVRGRMIV